MYERHAADAIVSKLSNMQQTLHELGFVALARIYGISNMQYPKLPSLVLVALFGLTACGGSSGGSEPETPTVTDSDGDGVQDSQDAFPK